jgi:hypothetical protein
MNVTDYLERARECAAMAEKMAPEDKKKLLEIAHAWLDLADDVAKKARKSDGVTPMDNQ